MPQVAFDGGLAVGDEPLDEIADFRRRHRLDLSFDEDVKRRFFEQIGEPKFHTFAVQFIVSRNDTWQAVGERLGVHQGTWSKWEKWWARNGGDRPSWKHLFTYLSLIAADPADVFPEHGRDVLYGGIRDALTFIAEHLDTQAIDPEGAAARARGPREEAWPCFVDSLLHLRFSDLRSQETLEQALTRILPSAHRLLRPSVARPDVRDLRRWIGAWLIPWGLFWCAVADTLDVE